MATQSSPLSIFQDLPKRGDRRRAVRQKVHSPAYASFDGIGGGMVLDLTEITDISEAGLSLQTPSPLAANRALNLVLDLSETKTYINTTGYVVWTDSTGRAGIRFSKMPDATRQQLRQWLFFNFVTAAAKRSAPEPGPDALSTLPELLTPSTPPANPLDSAALSALLKPTLSLEPQIAVADAPTLNAIQQEVEALGSDTYAALQVLAQRAQSLTRASGAAIALAEGTDMVCRASAGEAPPITARFQAGSGFSGECVRTGKLQRCDDSEVHPIVDRESCRRLGIRSMIAVPILSAEKILGLLEVFSPHAFAFEESDAAALRRISDIVAHIAEKQNKKMQLLAELATSPHSGELRFGEPRRFLKQRAVRVAAAIIAGLIVLVALGYFALRRPATHPAPSGPIVTQPPVSAPSGEPTTLDLLRKYAAQGDPVAQFSLGARYAQGEGVKQDYTEAVRWFSKAAEQGHVVAQATLGAYYWAGRGVQQDLGRAYFWSVLARAGGDEASKYRVAALTSRMTRAQVAVAQQQAEEWLRAHQTSRAAR